MQKITPCLWFQGNAEDAAQFYTRTFKNSRIVQTSRYGDDQPFPKGTALVVSFEVDGLQMMALNGNVSFPFSEAVSLTVHCDDQREIDTLWQQLTADGGKPSQCGWLKDKYGFSWQIVPKDLGHMMQDPDPVKAQRVLQALMKMTKIDISVLGRAHRA